MDCAVTRKRIAGILALVLATTAPAHADETDPFGLESGTPTSVPKEQILGNIPIDRIPALTDPAFIPAAEATWLPDHARVVGIEHAGVAKAYPTSILVWHEAVNDTVGTKPYLVTF